MTIGAMIRKNVTTANLLPFRATSLYAKFVGQLYVVFSYREDWPIYVHHPEHGWFSNADPAYSRTTAQHMSIARPTGADLKPMTLTHMLGFISQNKEATATA